MTIIQFLFTLIISIFLGLIATAVLLRVIDDFEWDSLGLDNNEKPPWSLWKGYHQ